MFPLVICSGDCVRFPPPALAEQTQCAEPGCEEKQGGFAALRLVMHNFERHVRSGDF
jgi:hypothetical protein